ncbi:iron-sulfur protein Isa2 [Myxozyma melibiosi]|uniref:Iron-sulfur protein Isa2 n=1 Tax=Myxozyma melibiosi TaxID=54550 RepID=A0ABR1F3G0_9ASCO
MNRIIYTQSCLRVRTAVPSVCLQTVSTATKRVLAREFSGLATTNYAAKDSRIRQKTSSHLLAKPYSGRRNVSMEAQKTGANENGPAAKTFMSSKLASPDAPPKVPSITNPRKDESGNDMLVYITPRASKKLLEIMKTDNNPNVFLRVIVESGGCHGFQYLMGLKEDYNPEEDIIFELDGARVVMDEMSLSILKDSTVDYTTELIGSQFKVVNNPRASSSCGCGSSFDIDLGA